MTEKSIERATIRVMVTSNGRRNSPLRFALVSPDGQPYVSSPEFKSRNPPPDNLIERNALDALLQDIRSQGWEIVRRPHDDNEWWAFQFARGDAQEVERDRQWALMSAPVSNVPSMVPAQREIVMVEKKRGCLGGCLSGIGAIVVGVIGLIVAIVVIAALATNSTSDDNDEQSLVNDQGSPEAAELGSGENPAPIGAAITGDGLELTVHSAQLSDTAGVLTSAEPGVMYLTIDASVRNISDEQKSYNMFYWSGRDIVNGYNFDDDPFAGDSPNPFSSGDIAPGDIVRGEVVLKVRDDSQAIRIKYDTSPFGGANLYWLFEAP